MVGPHGPRRESDAALVGGRYRIVQKIGSGGVGDVYLATTGADRVALKLLRPEHRRAPELVRRFCREAEAAARVHHPNVLSVLAPPAEHEGVLFFVMELLVGLDLADTLARAGRLGSPRAVGIALAAADGLAAAHAAGVVHRDVKPENIFLVHAPDGRERVKVLDFGFASLESSSRTDAAGPRASMGSGHDAPGTPEYMAPEHAARGSRANGALMGPACDVYALGVVLFEMLAGARPERGGPAPRLADVDPPIVASSGLAASVARCLEPDPARRFSSMGELRAALADTPEAAAWATLTSKPPAPSHALRGASSRPPRRS